MDERKHMLECFWQTCKMLHEELTDINDRLELRARQIEIWDWLENDDKNKNRCCGTQGDSKVQPPVCPAMQ